MSNRKHTLVLGASEKPDRYANIAINRLLDNDIPVIAVGYKKGEVRGVPIKTEFPINKDIHTLTLYLSTKNQKQYYDDIVSLNPKRVIFNPGTYNKELEELLDENNIGYEHACTLVLLSGGNY